MVTISNDNAISRFQSRKYLANSSPAGFGTVASGGQWKPYTWQRIANYHMNRMLTGEVWQRKILMEVPAQNGKSQIGSYWTPAHCVCKWPRARIGIFFHTAEIAEQYGGMVRNAVDDNGHYFQRNGVPVSISSESASRKFFKTNFGGEVFTGGIGKGISGKSFDIVFVDDPFPNYAASCSKTIRDGIWNWYLNDLNPRMNATSGRQSLVMNRWNSDDIIGRIKSNYADDADQWLTVRFPAIAEQDEFLPWNGKKWRSKGEALCPEIRGLDFYKEQKAKQANDMFESMYQQNPSTPGGNIFPDEYFQDVKYVSDWPPGINRIVVYLDPSLGRGEQADYQALVAVGSNTEQGGLIYVKCEMHRVDDLKLSEACAQFVMSLPHRPPFLAIEKAGHQEFLANTIRTAFYRNGLEHPERHVYVIMQEPKNFDLSKVQRIKLGLSYYLDNNLFRYVRGKDTSIMVDQMKNLGSKGMHDDGPDALNGAVQAYVEEYS